eukprot:6190443-Pleurochrysis_carterae.AAC.6
MSPASLPCQRVHARAPMIGFQPALATSMTFLRCVVHCPCRVICKLCAPFSLCVVQQHVRTSFASTKRLSRWLTLGQRVYDGPQGVSKKEVSAQPVFRQPASAARSAVHPTAVALGASGTVRRTRDDGVARRQQQPRLMCC